VYNNKEKWSKKFMSDNMENENKSYDPPQDDQNKKDSDNVAQDQPQDQSSPEGMSGSQYQNAQAGPHGQQYQNAQAGPQWQQYQNVQAGPHGQPFTGQQQFQGSQYQNAQAGPQWQRNQNAQAGPHGQPFTGQQQFQSNPYQNAQAGPQGQPFTGQQQFTGQPQYQNTPGGMNGTQYQNNPYYTRKKSTVSPERLKIIGMPTLVYSIICAAILYKNWSSILSAVLALVSVGFISLCLVKYEVRISAEHNAAKPTPGECMSKQGCMMPYYILVILLSVALCMTDDAYLIFGCNVGIIILEIYATIIYFNDTKGWGIIKGCFTLLEQFVSPIGHINAPFADRTAQRREGGKKKNPKLMYVIAGLAIALPLLVIVLKLLANADPVFEKVIKDLFGKIFFSWDIVGIIIFCLVIFLYVYGFIVKAPRRDLSFNYQQKKLYEPVIGITITSVLTLFYLIFAAVQIVYLFANSGDLPTGTSYAEYARQGFFQLLVVAVINLCIVIIFETIFEKSTVLKIALVVMCGCTYVMIASSAVRMIMYIKEYDLTYMRINVLFALAATALVMAGVIVKLFAENIPLFSYIMIAVMSLFTVFAYMKPQAVIAEYNLSHEHEARAIDWDYVLDTGNDGVPYIIDYLKRNDISPNVTIHELEKRSRNSDKYSYNNDYNNDYSYDDDYNYVYGSSTDTIIDKLNELKEENDDKGYVRSFNFSRYRSTVAINKL
jgi:hypothetical protein